MLPISLSLTNFLSYRDAAPTLMLDNVHVACICGPNGNGKSALLDAITWALWGKARGQRQEQLLHHGQTEMSVELVFDVGSERYRVSRRYSQARRTPQSSLELAVQVADNEFRPITGDAIRATEAAIERLINMDYETFVNSAFLVQGRADQFTMATPSQRKEVLSKVLGLGVYDRLEERAKARRNDANARLSASAVVLDRLRERAALADETRAALQQAESDLAAASAAVASLTHRLDLLTKHVANLERRQAEGTGLQQQMERAQSRKAEAEAEAAQVERRLAQWRAAIAHAADIEEGFALLQQARERCSALNTAAQRTIALQQELAPLEKAITQARASLESDIAAQQQHISRELQPRAQALPTIEQGLDGLASRAAAVEARSAEAAQATADHQQFTIEAQALRQENERLANLGKETKAKLELLDHEHSDSIACPLCASELGPDGINLIRTNYAEEIQAQRARYTEQQKSAEQLERRAEDAGKRTQQAQGEVDAERKRIDQERGKLTAQREEAERAAAQLEQASALLSETQNALANEQYATDEQAAARRIRMQIGDLAFSAAALAEAEAEEDGLAAWEQEHQALTEARARLDDDESAHERALVRAAEATRDLEHAAQARAAIEEELVELPSYVAQLAEVKLEQQTASANRDTLQSRTGSLTQQAEEIARATAEMKETEKQRSFLTEEVGAYAEVALAFGKGGVQALLIEAAIPRLEDEANDLLMRMTDGRMTLRMQTQRERKGGNRDEAIETLEIVIADELGTRAYEMFSGGERFRIDFAVRIALSKLLAWRAGAPLPTLFIDEGFGTQDAEGRDRILEVIKAIEDRFDRILVITHMDEIKEAFPVRIEVSRERTGSTFVIS